MNSKILYIIRKVEIHGEMQVEYLTIIEEISIFKQSVTIYHVDSFNQFYSTDFFLYPPENIKKERFLGGIERNQWN